MWMSRTLVTLNLMVMTLRTCHSSCASASPKCDRTKKPQLDLDMQAIEGTWYLKYTSNEPTELVDMTGLRLEVSTSYNADMTGAKLTQASAISMPNETCSNATSVCTITEDGCHDAEFDLTSSIVAAQYNSIFAIWIERALGNQCMNMLDIYVRDPNADADVTPIRDVLRSFCGDDATNFESSFYVTTLDYQNPIQCLMTE